MSRKGRLFVISGPSGVGKGTIVAEIIKKIGDNVKLSVSATTRKPREGEIDGVSYYFLPEEEFLRRVDDGKFLEHAEVHGHYYGTPRPPVEAELDAGRDVILEIDVQGAMNVKDNFHEGIFIFILPPSMKVLRDRLTGRGTESEEDIRRRMGNAFGEIEYARRYDYTVVNDDLDTAVDEVMAVITAEHHRVGENIEEIIEQYREEI